VLFKKPGLAVLLILFVLLLLVAGIYAVARELSDGDEVEAQGSYDHQNEDSDSEEEDEEELPPGWMPPPPRWFRSNAGGMALEETPSRLAALRNEFALVIDYISPDELDDFLTPFYKENYNIEIRVLFKKGEESRKQWLFRDENQNVRFNAVFRQEVSETEAASPESPEPDASTDVETEAVTDAEVEAEVEVAPVYKTITIGFIEIYNDKTQISHDYRFTDDGGETVTEYFYNGNILTKTETRQKASAGAGVSSGDEYLKMHTDTYRYNRSYFLRNIERVFHSPVEKEPAFLRFPARIMEMAYDKDLIKEKLTPGSDFIDSYSAGKDYRTVFDLDERGRILTQTMFDSEDEIVWVIINTWTGDRISSVLKTEGDSEKLTEYEYNNAGERTVQRDINNGVLERQVFTNGNKDTEELFMNGAVVLRAFYEDGRKIAEERIRRR